MKKKNSDVIHLGDIIRFNEYLRWGELDGYSFEYCVKLLNDHLKVMAKICQTTPRQYTVKQLKKFLEEFKR